MTPAAVELLAWLWTRPPLSSPRRVNTAIAIAEAASETESPQWFAAVLDVWAAGESRYSDDAAISGGCAGVAIGTPCSGGMYVGPWMVQRALVPSHATLVDEARIVIGLFRESARECAAWPFGLYSGFGCHQAALVDARVLLVVRELAFEGGAR